jgi:hypothetical protein
VDFLSPNTRLDHIFSKFVWSRRRLYLASLASARVVIDRISGRRDPHSAFPNAWKRTCRRTERAAHAALSRANAFGASHAPKQTNKHAKKNATEFIP